MLDFGWAELLMIAMVGVFIIGPKEIPSVMRTIGRLVRRVQYMKYSLSQQFDEFMGEDAYTAVNFEGARVGASLPDGHEGFDEAGEDEELVALIDKAAAEKSEGDDE